MNLEAAAVEALGLIGARPLGSGGQKTVMDATLKGERVAAKVVRLASDEGPEIALERARREFEALHRISDPHVVGVRSELVELEDAGEVVAAAWAEEFIEGDDFGALLADPWTWPATATMVKQVATGLSAFHDQGIIHRDLSPGNVRRRTSGSWVVLDPGYARFIDFSTITRAGQPGTVGHLSPEHVDPRTEPEQRSDIFQLGILAYVALTGTYPFDPNDAAALIRGRAQPVRNLRDDLSSAEAAVIDKMIDVRTARRHRNIHQLTLEIEDVS